MADEITLKPGWLALDLAKAAARMHVPTTDAELVTNILKLAGRGNEVPGNDAGTPPLLSRTGEANLLESALAAIPRLVATINAYKSATNLLSRGDLIQKIIAATTARDNALAKNEKAEAEIKRLREVLSKEPNVFMIAYENGDHERLSHGLGKANASFEAACWDLNAAQTSQKHLAEALLAYVEFTKNHGNKFGPLSPEIKKIDALAQATLIATGAVSADPSKALRSPISKMIFEKQQQEIAEERARNPTPDETNEKPMEVPKQSPKETPAKEPKEVPVKKPYSTPRKTPEEAPVTPEEAPITKPKA